MSDDPITTPSATRLEDAARTAGDDRRLPPVHMWDPPLSGEMDMRIARDGTWYHEGAPINRPALVRLFSTILRRDAEKDAGRYVLVTPVEKWAITVEDAPFVAVDFEARGAGEDQVLTFTTNVGDSVTAGPDAPLRVTRDGAEPAPYVLVRGDLEALIDRKSFYRLVELGAHRDGWFGIWTGGAFFEVIPSDEMRA
ncbi:DUF1285 domain-containing protein [Roseovarius spongiae]|uniref:DUF1285 domain-containing protein n=1 Tax=Roseovarius spongiae TaxID=2320272 RepID=A0A3A8B5Z7_9RHOB|nr:DUF1285 domain-containing protein [Roseovarius spongiae]RKF16135.1 DUF1285 domain-containing protein [Roseovarius spongiae]